MICFFSSFDKMFVETSSLSQECCPLRVDNIPNIGRCAGHDILIYPNDHEPPHVKISKGGVQTGKLPINVKDTSVVTYDVENIPKGALKKLQKYVKDKNAYYTLKWVRWNEMHK